MKTFLIVFSQNGMPVFGFILAWGHACTTAVMHGSSPRDFFAAIADCAMQRRFAGVISGFAPRLAPLCFPGNHSSSASTTLKNLCNAPRLGCPPPAFSTRAAIHANCVRPWSSRLTSRRASAFACAHAQRRPCCACSHASRSCSCAMTS